MIYFLILFLWHKLIRKLFAIFSLIHRHTSANSHPHSLSLHFLFLSLSLSSSLSLSLFLYHSLSTTLSLSIPLYHSLYHSLSISQTHTLSLSLALSCFIIILNLVNVDQMTSCDRLQLPSRSRIQAAANFFPAKIFKTRSFSRKRDYRQIYRFLLKLLGRELNTFPEGRNPLNLW